MANGDILFTARPQFDLAFKMKALNAEQLLRWRQRKAAEMLKIGDRLAVRVKAEGRKERLVEVFAMKDLDRLPELCAAVDRLPNTMWTSYRSDVLDRFHARKANTVARLACRAKFMTPTSSRT